MTLQSSFRCHWMPLMATRMCTFLLLAVILPHLIGNIAGDAYVIFSEEGNYSISFNGSHYFVYGGDYYDENSTYQLDYSEYETPTTKIFGNSASHLLPGLLPFFVSLLHLLRLLLQDIRI